MGQLWALPPSVLRLSPPGKEANQRGSQVQASRPRSLPPLILPQRGNVRALCRPQRGTTTKLLLVPPKGEQTAN